VDRRLLEARTLDAVNRVVAGRRVEDDLVECKAEWPDPARAVRRLAAHANAARGDGVVWIVGLDEDAHRVAELDGTEPSDWWAQAEKRFADGVAPDLTFLSVPTPHGSVYALGFATDRSPYMVTVSGGPAEREIPWRSGARTRSATRGEVLSLLVGAVAPPALELISPRAVATHVLSAAADDVYSGEQGEERIEVVIDSQVYFEPTSSHPRPAMLPAHLWEVTFDLGPSGTRTARATFRHNTVPGGSGPSGWTTEQPNPSGAAVRSSGIYVHGPDVLTLHAAVVLSPGERQNMITRPYVAVSVRLPVSGSPRAANTAARLIWRSGEEPPTPYDGRAVLGRWAPET
jgi:hypothetical protein